MHSIEEGTEMHTKGIETLFNEIVVGNFPNLGKEMDIKYRSHLEH
jgi:hypothetical protein